MIQYWWKFAYKEQNFFPINLLVLTPAKKAALQF